MEKMEIKMDSGTTYVRWLDAANVEKVKGAIGQTSGSVNVNGSVEEGGDKTWVLLASSKIESFRRVK